MHALSIQHIPFFFTYFLGSLKKFYSFYFFLFLSLHAISFRIVRKLYLISFPSQLSFHQSILFQIISNFHSFLTSWSWRLSSSPVQSHPSTLASRWSNFDPDSSRESSKTEGREAASERNRNKRIRNTKRVGFCLLKWVGAVFRHENLCVGQAPGNYAVDEMAGRKIERMVLESRGTSEQFACRSPIPPLPLLSFSSLQTNRNPSRVERESLREKFPLPFLFFFFLIRVFYIETLLRRGRDWFIRIIEYSANKTREWIERVLNIQALISLSLDYAPECIIPPRD